MLAGLLYCGPGIGVAAIRRALPWIVSWLPKFSGVLSEGSRRGMSYNHMAELLSWHDRNRLGSFPNTCFLAGSL
jgi:hypothetical protein